MIAEETPAMASATSSTACNIPQPGHMRHSPIPDCAIADPLPTRTTVKSTTLKSMTENELRMGSTLHGAFHRRDHVRNQCASRSPSHNAYAYFEVLVTAGVACAAKMGARL